MNDRSAPVRWSEVTDLGDGIRAVDTGFKRPLFDASHLIIENARAAFVDVATSYSVRGFSQPSETTASPRRTSTTSSSPTSTSTTAGAPGP